MPYQFELETAIAIARKAGELALSHFSRKTETFEKADHSPVTVADQECERLISRLLSESCPGDGILGEEGSKSTAPYTCRWIIDPLDGTTNYTYGYPLFGVSIALEKQGEITLGVVYNPILDELFIAEKGSGACLNGIPIHVTDTNELGKSLLASGFPYDAWVEPRNNCNEWEHFIKTTISVRCDGSAALDLCHTACGRLDGYWELDLESWDMAAGALIVQEAGGLVTQADGKPFSHLQRSVLASNGLLHQAMLNVLKR